LLDGYGIGGYGLETYGTHRSLEPEQYRAGPGDQIALDNYGETLLAMGGADGDQYRGLAAAALDRHRAGDAEGCAGRADLVRRRRASAAIRRHTLRLR